jgi:hypothetical protein
MRLQPGVYDGRAFKNYTPWGRIRATGQARACDVTENQSCVRTVFDQQKARLLEGRRAVF